MKLLIGLAIMASPFVEIYLLVKAANVIGFWWTLGYVFFSASLGLFVLQSQGRKIIFDIQRSLARGALPADALLSALLVIAAGVLLIIPGVISDIVAVFLLFYPTRKAFMIVLKLYLAQKIRSGAVRFYSSSSGFATQSDENVIPIEREAQVIDLQKIRLQRGSGSSTDSTEH